MSEFLFLTFTWSGHFSTTLHKTNATTSVIRSNWNLAGFRSLYLPLLATYDFTGYIRFFTVKQNQFSLRKVSPGEGSSILVGNVMEQSNDYQWRIFMRLVVLPASYIDGPSTKSKYVLTSGHLVRLTKRQTTEPSHGRKS